MSQRHRGKQLKQMNECLSFFVGNSFYPSYQSALSRTHSRFCGTTFVETAVNASRFSTVGERFLNPSNFHNGGKKMLTS